jgi:hypothetical protein
VDVAVLRQATVSGGTLSLRTSIKKRKMPMKHVRPKNLENEYLLGDFTMATAQPMLCLVSTYKRQRLIRHRRTLEANHAKHLTEQYKNLR